MFYMISLHTYPIIELLLLFYIYFFNNTFLLLAKKILSFPVNRLRMGILRTCLYHLLKL